MVDFVDPFLVVEVLSAQSAALLPQLVSLKCWWYCCLSFLLLENGGRREEGGRRPVLSVLSFSSSS